MRSNKTRGSATLFYKALHKLPMSLQNIIAAVLTRAGDPEPEERPLSHADHQGAAKSQALNWFPLTGGFNTHADHQGAAKSQTLAWGWLPMLALTGAIGLLTVAHVYTSARNGVTGEENFLWVGLLLIFVPFAARLISPEASRFERISLLCVVGIYLYLVRVIHNPLSFSPVDDFQHGRTAIDIAITGHLFTENPLLPVSAFYPGLAIVTNALSTLSGLSILNAGFIIIGIAHLVLILSLFMLVERTTTSARIAGIATLLYMTNSHFLFFDSAYIYESLALSLATFMLFAMSEHEQMNSGRRQMLLIAWLALGTVVVTHHVTSFFFDGFLILWAVVYGFQHPARVFRSNLVKTALLGVFMSVAWINLKGNPVVGYLFSYADQGLSEFGKILTGASPARKFFVDYGGEQTPLWQQIMTIFSQVLVMFGLPFGLLCLWRRYRRNALVWMFGIASLFYPLIQVFRFTTYGFELADRPITFLFIPISFVLAVLIAQFWPTRKLSWKQTSLITSAISVIYLGSVILGAGPPWELLPGPYLVNADFRSIETDGVQSAIWTYSYLGPNNRIATDYTNQLLMGTYGDQNPIVRTPGGVDVLPIFTSLNLNSEDISILMNAQLHYLVIDLRMSTALPRKGFYFAQGETGSYLRTTPIDRKTLTKFDTVPQIDRVFDNGNIVIYDLEGLVLSIRVQQLSSARKAKP